MIGHWMVLSSLLSSSSATLLSFPIVITITIFGIVSIVVGFFASQAVSSGSSVGVGWSAVSALVWTHVDTTAMQRRSSQSYKYSKYWCCQKCQSHHFKIVGCCISLIPKTIDLIIRWKLFIKYLSFPSMNNLLVELSFDRQNLFSALLRSPSVNVTEQLQCKANDVEFLRNLFSLLNGFYPCPGGNIKRKTSTGGREMLDF